MEHSAPILFCNCSHAKIIPPTVKGQVLDALSRSGRQVEVVPDLCELSARQDPRMKRFAEAGGLKVIACFPRAVKWLFHAAGAPLTNGDVEVLNMRAERAEDIVSRLLADDAPGTAAEAPATTNEPDGHPSNGWVPWFPVIDYDRCANCKQCLSFCLFGVYGLDGDGRVQVQKPASCKTGCPACARVCPNVAIIFPKHEQGPINGDEVSEEDASREPTKVDVPALIDGNVTESLRQRSRQVQQELGIPDEVLASLTGPAGVGAKSGTTVTDGNPAEAPPVEDEAPTPSTDEWGI
jgi:NAD-dependent dihydropyrimidine dehydrogenase PreA subunit